MTVTYSSEVANGSSFGCFWRILCKWRGSVYKLIWRELVAYLLIYFTINIVYRYALNDEQKRVFEKIRQYFGTHSESIPMSFVLGFYVTLVVGRWWQQYKLLPWPDTLALFVSAAIPGADEKGRLMRRNIVRFAILSYVITLQRVSLRVKKRFPSWQHMVDAGIMMESEKKIFDLMDEKNRVMSKYWMPLVWATNIINRARKESLISSDHLVQTILTELSDIRRRLGSLIGYDTVCLPLVYTQVVTLSVYSYFIAALMGRQFVPDDKISTNKFEDPDVYFPVFTTLQFVFYVGWLKVAEVLINPFGEDDDDIELNWLIDRHIKAAYMIVDQMHEEYPELLKDQYWEEVVPKDLPYTVASECYRRTEPKGSAENYKVKESDSIYSNLLAPSAHRKIPHSDDVYGDHPDLDYETVDTPVPGRRNWFQRQMHRMGSVRSTSTSYSSGRHFARTRHNSVYSSPESGLPVPGNGGNIGGPIPNTVVIPNQKMSLYDRLVGRKSSRGPQKKPMSLKNRPRIPTPDVTKEVMAQENRLSNISQSSMSVNTFNSGSSGYHTDMSPPVVQVVLSPIQEMEGGTTVVGPAATAALAQAVLSPTLQSAGLGQVALSPTSVTLTPVTVSGNQILTSLMLTKTPQSSPLPNRANLVPNAPRKVTPPKSPIQTATLTELMSSPEEEVNSNPSSNAGSIGSGSSVSNTASTASTLPLTDDRIRKISSNSQTGGTSPAKKKEVYV